MEKEGENYIRNLFKSARMERALMPLSSIMIAVGFTNRINFDIFLLMTCCVLMYMAGGIINAKFDKDFKLKKSTFAIMSLLGISIILSLNNRIIFFAVIASLFMGLIYSSLSRFILFGDSLVLSITHVAIPVVSSFLILNIDLGFSVPLVLSFIAPFTLIVPMKNLNGIEKDKQRGYKTLMTKYKNGKTATHFLLSFYFIVVFLLYFFLDLGNRFLFVVFVMFVIKTFMDYYMNTGKEIVAYGLVRLIIIIFPFAFVFDKAENIELVFLSFSFILFYLVYFALKVSGVKHGKGI